MFKRGDFMAKGKKKMWSLVGSWAFIIGVFLAIIAGIMFNSLDKPIVTALIIIGLLVGLLNVTTNETTQFLLATISLVLIAAFGGNILKVIPTVARILEAILILVIPATVIVALRSVYSLAKN